MTIKNYINGEWIDSHKGDFETLLNPSNGKEIGQVPLCDSKQSREATFAAAQAFQTWSKLP